MEYVLHIVSTLLVNPTLPLSGELCPLDSYAAL